ncbi:hypothetical protein ACYPKM_05300 [Pseudomonas aeruginosa]
MFTLPSLPQNISSEFTNATAVIAAAEQDLFVSNGERPQVKRAQALFQTLSTYGVKEPEVEIVAGNVVLRWPGNGETTASIVISHECDLAVSLNEPGFSTTMLIPASKEIDLEQIAWFTEHFFYVQQNSAMEERRVKLLGAIPEAYGDLKEVMTDWFSRKKLGVNMALVDKVYNVALAATHMARMLATTDVKVPWVVSSTSYEAGFMWMGENTGVSLEIDNLKYYVAKMVDLTKSEGKKIETFPNLSISEPLPDMVMEQIKQC